MKPNKPPYAMIKGIALLLAMLFVVIVSFRVNEPPPVVSYDAPDSVFSAERASEHLHHIASYKNPIGSEANEYVRNYIIDQLEELNLSPELQLTQYYDPELQRAASLGNVLACIPGTGDDGEAVLFMGHYDTVEDAYGASDNGAAVVTMLELIRLLKHHPPLKNDIIFLFTDGEEVGLLGAKAFLDEHPRTEDIGAVINLEARGTKGQSLMFETGKKNLKMIREFAEAVPYPASNSLSYEVYNLMPHYTDFGPFREESYQGLNFAYIENGFDYHTAGDNIENTDFRSIQHHGSHAKALALHLGNSSLDLSCEQDAVFFNTFGYGFAYYPYSWVIPLSIITLLVFITTMVIGFRKGFIKLKRSLFGLFGFVFYLLIIYVIINSVYLIISQYYPGADTRLLEYNRQWLMLGFSGIAIAFSFSFFRLLMQGLKMWHIVTLFSIIIILLIWSGQISFLSIILSIGVGIAMYFLFRKPTSAWNLTAGSLTIWAILMLIVSFIVPGASYLLTWPLLFSCIPIGTIFILKKDKNHLILQALLLFIFAIPALSWFPVLIHLFGISMGVDAAGIAMLITGIMMGLLIPHMDMTTRQHPWIVPSIAFILGIIFVLKGSVNLDYDQRYRKQNNIMYATSELTDETFWITSDRQPDSWTEQFLTKEPDTIKLKDFFPATDDKYLANRTTTKPLPTPSAKLVSDSIADDQRILTVEVNSERNASWMTAYIMAGNSKTGNSDLSIRINDLDKHQLTPIDDTKWNMLRYFAMPEEGILLTIYTDPGEKVNLCLTDHEFGLPDFIDMESRPEYMMPRRDRSIATMRFVY